MYKIYINETPLFLVKNKQDVSDLFEDSKTLYGKYRKRKKFIANYIDMLEKGGEYDAVILYGDDYEGLVNDFMSFYKILPAAGGLVFNEDKEILMIYRRGFWDLPKGKVEKDETIEAAAIREVQEETGIKHVELGPKLVDTYHTYFSKSGKRILKLSHWFLMFTSDRVLIPQVEEDIEKAIWIKKRNLLDEKKKVYRNILEVLSFG